MYVGTKHTVDVSGPIRISKPMHAFLEILNLKMFFSYVHSVKSVFSFINTELSFGESVASTLMIVGF
jgi:hypothetical protein